MHVPHMYRNKQRPKEMLDTLELEFEAVVSCQHGHWEVYLGLYKSIPNYRAPVYLFSYSRVLHIK